MSDQDQDAPHPSQDDSHANNPDANQRDVDSAEVPIIAKVVGDGEPNDMVGEESDAKPKEIRTGSPFASDPEMTPSQDAAQTRKLEKFYDVGPLRYTAMGAVAASAMVIVFASIACWWFPGGGALIAGLGCALAAFGMFSHMRTPAIGCLVVHMALFVVSYSRLL